jgi:CRP-like cAMP-binding protein
MTYVIKSDIIFIEVGYMKFIDESVKKFYTNKYGILSYFAKDLYDDIELLKFNKGDIVINTNEVMEYFYFLVKGSVKVYTVNEMGKALSLTFCEAGEILGDLEIATGDKTTCNVEVLEDCIFVVVKLETLKTVYENDTEFYKYIAKNLAVKLLRNTYQSRLNQLHSLETRLSEYLITISKDEDKTTFKLNKFVDLAELFGTSYRHLLRTFTNLEKKGIIIRKRNVVTIIDMTKLKALAEK